MHPIRTCLWFDGKAEEAAHFYVSLLPNSRIESVNASPVDTPGNKAGEIITVEFTLNGVAYLGLNGGSHYQFTPAVSLIVPCDTQEEIDRLWSALSDGGTPVQCGWITDRYGLSWQITPRVLLAMIKDPDTAKAKRAMEAMFDMVKLDIAALETAYHRS
ncbi:VOC family protein [Starkeya sp. 3C]|uniref:VOC family protein n=1 Tax=Ancylobacter moscoviensis TaxID=2597768 RepID=A0ABY3DTR4_9HYPH|nr:VOC family protein [Ancylobacter moscoviensis]TSJ63810.1 VOC family protein [Ancylobacter moscoviensis]